MHEITVKGRDLKKPVVSLIWDEDGGLSLRVDDESRPEFWMEVHIPASALDALEQQR